MKPEEVGQSHVHKILYCRVGQRKLTKRTIMTNISWSQPDPWVKISEKAVDSFCVLNRLRNEINESHVMQLVLPPTVKPNTLENGTIFGYKTARQWTDNMLIKNQYSSNFIEWSLLSSKLLGVLKQIFSWPPSRFSHWFSLRDQPKISLCSSW